MGIDASKFSVTPMPGMFGKQDGQATQRTQSLTLEESANACGRVSERYADSGGERSPASINVAVKVDDSLTCVGGGVAADAATQVEFHRSVPDFAEAALERLHPNIYASLAQIRLRGTLDDVVTYARRDHGELRNLLLLYQQGRTLKILNEGLTLSAANLAECVSDLFAAWPTISAISLHACAVEPGSLPYPLQRYVCNEDIVLDLPDSVDAYLARLGKSTRSYLHRYLGKLKRSLPRVEHRVVRGAGIDPAMLHALISLNRQRMHGKGKDSILDPAATQRIVQLARRYGMVSAILIDGRLCAGTINYEIGGHTFLEVIAHDPSYNDFRLGTLCCYLTICEAIERRGLAYHFLWGRSDYKFRLGGTVRELEHLTIYRSAAHLLPHVGTVLQNQLALWERAARVRLMRDDKWARLVRQGLQRLRG